MTAPQIMAYVGPDTNVSGMTGSVMLPNWVNNQIYNLKEGGGGTDGFRQFTGYMSGDETLDRTRVQVGSISFIESAIGPAQCITAHGRLVFYSDLSNSTIISEVKAIDLTFSSNFGIPSGSTAPSNTTRICSPYSMGAMSAGGADFVLTSSLFSLEPGEVNILTSPGLTNLRLGATTESQAVIGRGFQGSPLGTVFILGKGTSASYVGGSTVPLGLYVVSSSAIVSTATLTKIGTVSPAQVDPTWVHFSEPYGLAYDQTDGNPIIMVTTPDAVTNTVYFVKLNKSTAAVIWACPVNAVVAFLDANLKLANIVNQTLYYLGASNTLYTINTNTGVATSQVIGTLTLVGGQMSEDVNNSIILYGNWTETSTHPTYIGTYMGTLGNHTLAGNTWIRFFPDGATAPFPQPPSVPGEPSVSINRAWAFTLDGHWFYALDLGIEGTFVYDDTTQHWSNFYTAGFGKQWDVANGTMWGQRIVGGDLATTDVWEYVPSALLDNATLDITHVVTGGVSTRSRDFISCDSVRVSGSMGIIQDAAGVTFNLRFSDDNGQAWSAYYPVTLTEGNFGDEVAWRSLGSFDAPGRIFELSDMGGLVRIDGCDMNPEAEEPKEQ